MNLNVNNWKPFLLGNLFVIKKGKRLTSEEQEDGIYNYVGAIDSNNGIANHIGQAPIHEGNTISLSYNGSVGEAFYQKDPYWATDDVNALYCKYSGFNKYIGLFIVTILKKEKFKFSYGRKWTLEKMNTTEIMLPAQHNSDGTFFIDKTKKYSDQGYVPDWQWMEDYIKSLNHKPLTTKNKVEKNYNLNTDKWKNFKIPLLFNISAGTYYSKDDYEIGNTPYVSASDINNGICERISLKPDFTKNKITIGKVGATTYYQSEDFCATSDVNVLTPLFEMNKYTGLFIAQIINTSENYKWSYGRQCRVGDTNKIIIKLPVVYNDDGTIYIDNKHIYSDQGYVPDWQWMEDYIKSLPYGDKL